MWMPARYDSRRCYPRESRHPVRHPRKLHCTRRLQIDLRRVEVAVERAIEAARASGMPYVDWWVKDRTGAVLDQAS